MSNRVVVNINSRSNNNKINKNNNDDNLYINKEKHEKKEENCQNFLLAAYFPLLFNILESSKVLSLSITFNNVRMNDDINVPCANEQLIVGVIYDELWEVFYSILAVLCEAIAL